MTPTPNFLYLQRAPKQQDGAPVTLPFLALPLLGRRQDLANASLSSLSSSAPEDTDVGVHTGTGPSTDADGNGEDGLSFRDVRNVFEEMTGLLDGPCPVPDLDQFVGLGTVVAGDLDDGAYGQVVNSMESGWVFGNLITQGTLHFAPAAEPAVG